MATHVNALNQTEDYIVVQEYVRNLYAGDVLHGSRYGVLKSAYACKKDGRNHVWMELRLPSGVKTTRRWCLNTLVLVRRPAPKTGQQ